MIVLSNHLIIIIKFLSFLTQYGLIDIRRLEQPTTAISDTREVVGLEYWSIISISIWHLLYIILLSLGSLEGDSREHTVWSQLNCPNMTKYSAGAAIRWDVISLEEY